MAQINVRPPRRDQEGERLERAADSAGMGAGMLLILVIGLVILLILAWFLIRPLFFTPVPAAAADFLANSIEALL